MGNKKGISICFFSDSHGWHDDFELPEADIAICCGDITMRGLRTQTESFMGWYSKQPVKHKVMIAGNHDYWFDKSHPKSLNFMLEDDSHLDVIPDDIVYLQDSMVEIDGIKIWGSPITPWFLNWAFNKHPEDLKTFWKENIPDEVDIIVTHGPPANTKLDLCKNGKRAGCPSLMHRVIDIMPKIVAFGHIHEGYGTEEWSIPDAEGKDKVITLINCSVLNERYYRTNEPVLIEWDKVCKLHENEKKRKDEKT